MKHITRESFLTLGVPEGPEDSLVAERVLATLHHKLQLVVDVVRRLLLHKTTNNGKIKLRTVFARLETRPGGMQQQAVLSPGRRQQIDGKGGRNVGLWSRYGG